MPNSPFLDRRELLRVGGLMLGGLSLSQVAAARAASSSNADTSVILVYCLGGPSQLETYDLKPDGPAEMRSIFKPIPTKTAGLSICELLPLQAQVADRFSIIRSMHHKISIHNDGSINVLTGKEPSVPDPSSQATSEHPDFGMIASKLRGPHPAAMPQYVSIPYPFQMIRPTYLGAGSQPFATGDVSNPNSTPPGLSLRGLTAKGFDDRRRLLNELDHCRAEFDRMAVGPSMDQFRQQAYGVLTSPAVARAFDMISEPDKLRERYGRHSWGQACLMARRLSEAGTAVVSVLFNTPENGPKFTNWDDHPGNAMRPGHFGDYMRVRLPYFDQSVSALIEDVFARGLDKRILIVVMGEFGRTPKLRTGPPNQAIGRDHWPDAYSALVSGGELRMGQVVGSTNARAEYPTSAATTPQDVLATVYRHLGIDYRQSLTDSLGRAVPLLTHGEPVRQLI